MEEKKAYVPPAIIFESDLEVRAGSPGGPCDDLPDIFNSVEPEC